MPRIQPSGRVAAALALLVSGLVGCQSTSDAETLENQNRNLLGTIESEQRRIDELVAEKTELDRRVRQLEAQLSKMESAEAVVEEAKGEITAQVRELLERFRGDSDVEMERTEDGYRFVLREAVLYGSGSAELTPLPRPARGRCRLPPSGSIGSSPPTCWPRSVGAPSFLSCCSRSFWPSQAGGSPISCATR